MGAAAPTSLNIALPMVEAGREAGGTPAAMQPLARSGKGGGGGGARTSTSARRKTKGGTGSWIARRVTLYLCPYHPPATVRRIKLLNNKINLSEKI